MAPRPWYVYLKANLLICELINFYNLVHGYGQFKTNAKVLMNVLEI